MTRTQEHAAGDALTVADRRHLLRRLAFAATPALERTLEGLPADEALGVLLRAARDAPDPERPEAARGIWDNPALRFEGVSDEDFEALVDRQAQDARAAIEGVRRWWLAELLTSPAPLRENLVLFLHGVFGSSTGSVVAPHALHGRNALFRRRCLGTVPDLLASLVVDPAMMMQIGMDDHRRLRVSDRPAMLILDHWTVGAGAYEPRDVEALSRALTGWLLVAPDGREPARPIDPRAPRAARRTGLVPTFRPEEFDAGPKTLLGRTSSFDARSAVRWLASQEATARRFGRLLIAHLGASAATSRWRACSSPNRSAGRWLRRRTAARPSAIRSCCWGWTLPQPSPTRRAVRAPPAWTTSGRSTTDSRTPRASPIAPGPGRARTSTIPTPSSAKPSGGPAT